MNERILKLAEQATIQSVSENFTGEKLEIITPSKEWAVKFAELIVRESIEVIKQNDYHGEWLGEKIKEHFDFGVKE